MSSLHNICELIAFYTCLIKFQNSLKHSYSLHSVWGNKIHSVVICLLF